MLIRGLNDPRAARARLGDGGQRLSKDLANATVHDLGHAGRARGIDAARIASCDGPHPDGGGQVDPRAKDAPDHVQAGPIAQARG